MNYLVPYVGKRSIYTLVDSFVLTYCSYRTKNYQKKMTTLGTQGHELNCIRKIQAMWRGYWARKQFKWKLRRYYRQGLGNEDRRKKYMEKEFTALSSKMDQTLDNRNQQVNSLLR